MAITRRQRLVIGYSIFGSSNAWKNTDHKTTFYGRNLLLAPICALHCREDHHQFCANRQMPFTLQIDRL